MRLRLLWFQWVWLFAFGDGGFSNQMKLYDLGVHFIVALAVRSKELNSRIMEIAAEMERESW